MHKKILKFVKDEVDVEDEVTPTEVGDYYPDQKVFCLIEIHELY